MTALHTDGTCLSGCLVVSYLLLLSYYCLLSLGCVVAGLKGKCAYHSVGDYPFQSYSFLPQPHLIFLFTESKYLIDTTLFLQF